MEQIEIGKASNSLDINMIILFADIKDIFQRNTSMQWQMAGQKLSMAWSGQQANSLFIYDRRDISRFSFSSRTPCSLGWFLFSKNSEIPFVYVPKLFPLLHWFQNTFCFLSSSTPSHVGNFFWLQWEFQWENDKNKKNGQKSLFRGPKWFPKCLNGGFRGGICIEKWS